MLHDPIVDEIRAIREQLASQFNFDIRQIVADAQRRQAASKARIVSFQRTAAPSQQMEASLEDARDRSEVRP
ncbi:MAG TPA: hypothetical protein VND64_30715 [Pirellulales bacterium]|nr:hypothetical protein [Pirellulales bacterium]